MPQPASTLIMPAPQAETAARDFVHASVFVLHADNPTFGFKQIQPDDRFTMAGYLGAHVRSFDTLLELAYIATQNIDKAWDTRVFTGLAAERPSLTRLPRTPCRSTSVGDVLIREDGLAAWVVAGIGFVKIDDRLLLESLRCQLPYIRHNATTDRFENKVSVAHLGGDRRANVVHHRTGPVRSQSTAYRGRGVGIKVTHYYPSNDCIPTTLTIGGYVLSWGDGDLLGIETPDGLPDLKHLSNICAREDIDRALCMVLGALWDVSEAWTHKVVPPRPPAAPAA